MITMLLGGLWHGASWTFVFWGGLHGIGLVFNHLWRALGYKMHWFLGRVVTFVFVVECLVFFRAETFSQALVVTKGMINWHDIGLFSSHLTMPWGRKEIIVIIITYLLISFWVPNSMQLMGRLKPKYSWAILTGLLLLISILGFSKTSTFIYYQF